jgi:hypothetical protein
MLVAAGAKSTSLLGSCNLSLIPVFLSSEELLYLGICM